MKLQKFPPYELIFGRTINLPIDLVIGHPDSNYIVPEYSSGYVFSLSTKLEKIHEFAKKHIALSSNNMKRLYDRSKHLIVIMLVMLYGFIILFVQKD